MNMLYAGLKEKGALMLIPSSAVESMGMGGMLGAAAMRQATLTSGNEVGQKRSHAAITRTRRQEEHLHLTRRNIMTTQSPDRLAMRVKLMLMILGAFLCLVGLVSLANVGKNSPQRAQRTQKVGTRTRLAYKLAKPRRTRSVLIRHGPAAFAIGTMTPSVGLATSPRPATLAPRIARWDEQPRGQREHVSIPRAVLALASWLLIPTPACWPACQRLASLVGMQRAQLRDPRPFAVFANGVR